MDSFLANTSLKLFLLVSCLGLACVRNSLNHLSFDGAYSLLVGAGGVRRVVIMESGFALASIDIFGVWVHFNLHLMVEWEVAAHLL